MSFTALRLALGTLTVIDVGPLPAIDPRSAGRAMLLAPLAALPLGIGVAVVGGLGGALGLPGLVVGLAAVGGVALGTRAMHLDGLADTADGLGSGWDPERALTVMKRGDVGPMGVVTLIVVLGLQAAALADLVQSLSGAVLAGLLLVVSRAALSLVCRRGVPAARPTGLGVVVAGTVPGRAAGLTWLAAGLVLGLVFQVVTGQWWLGVLAAGLAVAGVLLGVRHCVRRFGGVTGDVMGAAVELAFTVLLLVAVAR